tara:strand:+ start:61 stop:288 length:228 start_codon:yes stop_codon:yes gene_type:complete
MKTEEDHHNCQGDSFIKRNQNLAGKYNKYSEAKNKLIQIQREKMTVDANNRNLKSTSKKIQDKLDYQQRWNVFRE